MPISLLDRHTALVIIDLQNGIVALPTAHPSTFVVERASTLAAAFRDRGLPVILVNVRGMAPGRTERPFPAGDLPESWSDLVDELDAQPGDHRVTKFAWGAFETTSLRQHLMELGVTEIVLAGISTSAGVESTARTAHEQGFNVAFAVDAMTDTDLDAHLNSIKRIFPAIGETGTTDEIIGMLDAIGVES